MAKLSMKKTDKILKVLEDYGILVIDVESSNIVSGVAVVSEEYFNEKINEALEK
jgi:major membrane immunogen (membrane-anchored lipoprotein)